MNGVTGEITLPHSLARIGDTGRVHARSALFDLYGDHLLDRGGWAPISAAVGLLGSLQISAPAVRTAVSRMSWPKSGTGSAWSGSGAPTASARR